MKIKNEHIIIQNGKKQIKLHNTILNSYLHNIAYNQINTNLSRAGLKMNCVYLKFDNYLEFDKTSNLTEEDFDLLIYYYTSNTDITPKTIINTYFYKIDKAYELSTFTWITDFSNYYKRKITAIGFAGIVNNHFCIYACVNTFNYNLSIEDSSTLFSIARKDIISTDAIFYSPDTIKGPIHLCDGQYHYDGGFPDYQLFGILDSIGLGLNPYKMDVSVALTPYEYHVHITQNQMEIVDELTIEYYSDGLFPSTDIYPNENIYPARIIEEPLYPSEQLYPANDLYMLESPYQYVQLKYYIYKLDTINETITNTGKYYLLSMPIKGKKKIKMNIEYEGA